MKNTKGKPRGKPTAFADRGEIKKLTKEELANSRMSRLGRYPGPEIFEEDATDDLNTSN